MNENLAPVGDIKLVPFLEIVPAPSGNYVDALVRSGIETINVDTGEKLVGVDYWDPYTKFTKLAQVWSVIKDGIETIIRINEWVPGSVDLKVGDTRPAPAPSKSAGGTKPHTFNPKKDGSLGTASGGQQPDQWKSDSKDESGRTKPDPTGGEDDGSEPSGSAPDDKLGSGENSSDQYIYLGQGPKRQNEDGSTSQNTLHQRVSDGVYVQTVTTTQKDGSQSQEQHCYKDSQEVDCGMTDEPSCRVDCERLGMLRSFSFAVAEATLRRSAARHRRAQASRSAPRGAIPRDGSATAPPPDSGDEPDCADAETPGGPSDYGDPTDPNAEEPPDIAWLILVLNDGVTDPVEPGAAEEVVADSVALAMYGTLRDPAGPPGSQDEDAIPGGGPPDPGDAEQKP